MSTFKDFFVSLRNSRESRPLLLEAQKSREKGVDSVIQNLPANVPVQTDPSYFKKAVETYIESDKFISELSDKIGMPKPLETKEQFVSRAKAAMKEILDQELGSAIRRNLHAVSASIRRHQLRSDPQRAPGRMDE